MRAPSLGGIVGPQTSTLEEAGLLQMSALVKADNIPAKMRLCPLWSRIADTGGCELIVR